MVVTTYSKICKHNLKAFITSVSFKTACLYDVENKTIFLLDTHSLVYKETVLFIYVSLKRIVDDACIQSALLKEQNNKESRIWTGIEHL